MSEKLHNFNAGPAILPKNIFEKTSKSILDFNGSGLSILEISHRSKEFKDILSELSIIITGKCLIILFFLRTVNRGLSFEIVLAVVRIAWLDNLNL